MRRLTRPVLGRLFAVCLAVFLAGAGQASDTGQPIDAILSDARMAGCGGESGALALVLCTGTIRIGARGQYKNFSQFQDGEYRGFEPDLARLIAARIGVRAEFVPVTAVNRMARLGHGDIDIILATMAHTVSRGQQIAFVRPHYYGSPTAVAGPRGVALPGLPDIAGHTVCVPLGNFSNVVLSRHHARLMIFEGPDRLLDALRLNVCSLVAHDRTLLAANLTGVDADPDLADRFEEKFAFDFVPWGIGVAPAGAESLRRVLGLIVADLHRSGTLIALARANHIDETFLRQQQRVWSDPACRHEDGEVAEACLLRPADLEEKPTAFAPAAIAVEEWLHSLGVGRVSFPMFKGEDSWRLFLAGIVNSLILVAGAIAATTGICLVLQSGLRARLTAVRIPVRALTGIVQCSPVILLLVLGYLIVTQWIAFSTPVALATAIVVIGLSNGSFAAAAVADAAASLEQNTPLAAILIRAAPQIMSFAVNAARASAVASFIGTPELLSALTDITSYTSERRTTFVLLLIFYMAVVIGVVALCRAVTRRLAPLRGVLP